MRYSCPVDDGVIRDVSGEVLVGRSPSLHPGDIRKVTAVNPEDYPQLKHLIDVVVFSQHGEKPLPHLLAGGDLDGDTFFVSYF